MGLGRHGKGSKIVHQSGSRGRFRACSAFGLRRAVVPPGGAGTGPIPTLKKGEGQHGGEPLLWVGRGRRGQRRKPATGAGAEHLFNWESTDGAKKTAPGRHRSRKLGKGAPGRGRSWGEREPARGRFFYLVLPGLEMKRPTSQATRMATKNWPVMASTMVRVRATGVRGTISPTPTVVMMMRL